MINTTIRTCVILFPLFVLSSCGSYKTPAAPSAVSLAGDGHGPGRREARRRDSSGR